MNPTVALYNPLPAALSHYERALVATVRSTGANCITLDGPSAEIGRASTFGRLWRAFKLWAWYLRLPHRESLLVVCWPTFGLIEPLAWMAARYRGAVLIMMHDPLPLRRQAGMRRYMGQLGGLAKRVERVRIAVHSEPARSAMAELGWQSLPILPMPVLIKSRDDPPLRPQRVSVIGQWKPARDVDLLRQLGPALRARGSEPAITGRHWPDVEGWDVRSAFVSEETIEEELRATTCVVLPYKHFFQSDVAVRALEAQVPVVGPRQPFLEDLFGADWPGLVSSAAPEAWLDAVATVQALPPAVMRERLLAFAARSTEGWTTFLKCSLESGWLS